jgi:hypothetical protein
MSMLKSLAVIAAGAALSAAAAASGATSFPGNGATGFGGAVGTGSLSVSDDASSMTLTFNRGAGQFNDVLVLYLDTQGGGFIDNSTFGDNGDGGRTAISGTNNGNPSKSVVALPFEADYAVAIQNGFIGVFKLASGGDNSLGFLFGQPQSGNNSDASYSITLSSAQMLTMGLSPGTAQVVGLTGTYVSTSAYRSNESIGASVTVAGDGSGNAGFNNPATLSASFYTLSIPEPATLSLAGVALAGVMGRRRKA